jgi:hypothetical protein
MKRAGLAVLLAVSLVCLAPPAADAVPWCRDFGYGNAGYAAGYSVACTRAVWGGDWCGPRRAWACGPRIPRWCGPCVPFASPRCGPGWWFGSPCFGGWYGGGWYRGYDSVFLSTAAGGGTFFSGAIVPYPTWYGGPANWLPGWGVTPWGVSATPYGTLLPAGVGPQFGPAGVLPYLGISAATTPAAGSPMNRTPSPRPVIAAAELPNGRDVSIRASTGLARLRAARLVASGDEQLRKAAGDATKLTAALASYRQAAAAAEDQPDTHVRQAIVLTALNRQTDAESAIRRAIAADGRLADQPAAGPLQSASRPDPVFDRRPADGSAAIARRGDEILREIGGGAAADREAVAWLANCWSHRWRQAATAVATTR